MGESPLFSELKFFFKKRLDSFSERTCGLVEGAGLGDRRSGLMATTTGPLDDLGQVTSPLGLSSLVYHMGLLRSHHDPSPQEWWLMVVTQSSFARADSPNKYHNHQKIIATTKAPLIELNL